MLHKLLLLICLTGTVNAIAQKTAHSSSKATEKQGEAKIESKDVGAPMPRLKIVAFEDTFAAGKAAARPTEKDNMEISGKGKKKSKQHTSEKPQPAMAGHDAHKEYYTNSDFDNGANLLVMLFNPTCSHCEDETELLEKNIFLFNKTKIVMVASSVMGPYMPNFIKSFHIYEYPSIYIGLDSSNIINELFLYKALPQLNIYDKDRKLIKVFTGEASIDSLKSYIQ